MTSEEFREKAKLAVQELKRLPRNLDWPGADEGEMDTDEAMEVLERHLFETA